MIHRLVLKRHPTFNQIRHVISFVLCLPDALIVATRSLFTTTSRLPRSSPRHPASTVDHTQDCSSNASHNTPPVGRHSRQRQPLRSEVFVEHHPPPRQPNPSASDNHKGAPSQQKDRQSHRPATSQKVTACRGDTRDSLPLWTSSVRGRGHLIQQSDDLACIEEPDGCWGGASGAVL